MLSTHDMLSNCYQGQVTTLSLVASMSTTRTFGINSLFCECEGMNMDSNRRQITFFLSAPPPVTLADSLHMMFYIAVILHG